MKRIIQAVNGWLKNNPDLVVLAAFPVGIIFGVALGYLLVQWTR